MAKTRSRTKAETRSLGDSLFATTQQRVLGILFGETDRTFYASELIRRAGIGSGAVQRELKRLEQSGIVTARWIGKQKHYQANSKSPIFTDLRNIVEKTFGLAEPLRQALAPLSEQIDAAFIYGSVAKRRDTSQSDVDLMVISDALTYRDVFGALEPQTQKLKRKINPTVFSQSELESRLKAGNAFLRRVFAGPKVWLIGSEHELPA